MFYSPLYPQPSPRCTQSALCVEGKRGDRQVRGRNPNSDISVFTPSFPPPSNHFPGSSKGGARPRLSTLVLGQSSGRERLAVEVLRGHRKPASSLDTEGQACKTGQGRREDRHLPERMTSLHPPELMKLSVAENSWRTPVPKKEWGKTLFFYSL